MGEPDPRAALAALIAERRADCASLSRLIGRNPAYVQQFIRRGTPRRLAEVDRAVLARFFGVSEAVLGGPPRAARATHVVPRLDLAASAGPGRLAADPPGRPADLPEPWLRRIKPHGSLDQLSLIDVSGTSMLPTLAPGDEILVDGSDTMRRDGLWVLRAGDELLVKRLTRDGAGWTIRSDNPDAPPVAHDPSDVVVVGRVLWAGRRL